MSPRRKKAANTLTWLLIIIIVLNLTGAYCFTPEQAAEKCIVQNAAGDMMQYEKLQDGPFRQYRLCVNHELMMLVKCEFSLFGGWQGNNAMSFARDTTEAIEVGMLNAKLTGDGRAIYLFGGVNDGSIASFSVLGKFRGDVEDFDIEVPLPWYDMAVYPDTTYFIKKVTDFYDPSREQIGANRSVYYPEQFHIVTYGENNEVIDAFAIEKAIWE